MSKLNKYLKVVLIAALAFTVPNSLIAAASAQSKPGTASHHSSLSTTKKPMSKSSKHTKKHTSAKKTVAPQGSTSTKK